VCKLYVYKDKLGDLWIRMSYKDEKGIIHKAIENFDIDMKEF
jgi:hypothetical protein